jgi:DNA-directed RNA polymerase specialized sigma24 family protein
MKWCLACGAVQWGTNSCEACGDRYRTGPLGFRDLYKSYARQLQRFVRRVAADRGLSESLADTDGIVHDTFVVLLSSSGQPIRNPAAWLFGARRSCRAWR